MLNTVASSLSPEEKFQKDKTTLAKHLNGARYFGALQAMAFAEHYHPGFRKDGKTPAFHHQVQIGFTAYNLRDQLPGDNSDALANRLITLMFLHDTYEDNQGIQVEEVAKGVNRQGADDMVALSKIRNGQRMDNNAYYNGLLSDPILVTGKLLDRKNNIGTIFELSPAKQVEYVGETSHLVRVAKEAVVLYPEFTNIIQSLRSDLKRDVNLYLGCMRLVQTGRAPDIAQRLEQARHLVRSEL